MKNLMVFVAAFLALVGPASGGQADEDLVLKSKRVDVRIRENLALITFEYVVENPSARPAEGEVSFSVPEGAAVYEATLARNVSSKDRVSKLIPASDAVRAFAAMGTEVRQADTAQQAKDPSGATSLPGGTLVKLGRKNVSAGSYPVHGDPALLELIAGYSYRLRFFPVMPRDDQKVTFALAVEASKGEGGYELRIPLSDEARFDRKKAAASMIRIAGIGISNLASESHDLRRAAGGTQEAELGSAETLVLRYAPGAKPRPFSISSEESVAGTDEWGRAIRALRDVRGSAKGDPAAVSRENSLLVIDRAELKRLLTASEKK